MKWNYRMHHIESCKGIKAYAFTCSITVGVWGAWTSGVHSFIQLWPLVRTKPGQEHAHTMAGKFGRDINSFVWRWLSSSSLSTSLRWFVSHRYFGGSQATVHRTSGVSWTRAGRGAVRRIEIGIGDCWNYEWRKGIWVWGGRRACFV